MTTLLTFASFIAIVSMDSVVPTAGRAVQRATGSQIAPARIVLMTHAGAVADEKPVPATRIQDEATLIAFLRSAGWGGSRGQLEGVPIDWQTEVVFAYAAVFGTRSFTDASAVVVGDVLELRYKWGEPIGGSSGSGSSRTMGSGGPPKNVFIAIAKRADVAKLKTFRFVEIK